MGVAVHLYNDAECLALDLQRRLPGRPKLSWYRKVRETRSPPESPRSRAVFFVPGRP